MSVSSPLATGALSEPADASTRLVERARQGDIAAFEQLVAQHQAIAFRTACAILRDPAEAEDAVQEAFLSAYRNLHRFRAGSPFRAWLLTIVGNQARNRLRARGVRQRMAQRSAATEPRQAAHGGPEAAAVEASRDRELREALLALSEREREVIWLRYFAGLSEAEMASALGCRRGTVKSRLSRALDSLRAVVGEEVSRV